MASTGSETTVLNCLKLDKHFLTQIISEPVEEFSISPGSKHGDNIKGKLLSVNVKTRSNSTHNLLLKSSLPMTGPIDRTMLIAAEVISGWDAFPLEICYYEELRPKFQEATKGHPRITLFSGPKYYSGEYNEENGLNDYLVLEDLRPSGYTMLDKYKGLILEQTEATLKQLAIFHAVSYCLLNGKTANKRMCEMRNDPKCRLNTHVWDTRTHPFMNHDKLYNGIMLGMIDIIRQDMGKVEVAQGIEDKFATKAYQIMLDLWERTGKEDKYFPVLIHGDLWTNNILYKLAPDGRSVEDVKFIDFQMIRFGNIYEDLHYFIFTSTTPTFRRGNLQTCLKLYYDEFVKVVKEMGDCPLPKGFTLEELTKTFDENRNYGSSFNLLTIPFQLGISPPPPAVPSSPKDGNDDDKDTSPLRVKREEIDFEKRNEALKGTLTESVRKSPVALAWLKELLDEMIEHEVI